MDYDTRQRICDDRGDRCDHDGRDVLFVVLPYHRDSLCYGGHVGYAS